ncbi:MAG TPA: PAS domain-containing protein, partial [Rhodothermales bacterium]|nr:PAS domain-containing protein [Rhodothermales bacterium]
MRRSSWPARLLAGILLALPCRAQPQAEHLPPVVTPAEVRRDADGDTVPDGVGQAFTVGGRASLPARPGESHFNTALQSGRAGLVLVGDSVAAPVQPGDSLVVTGTLEFRRGQALLRVASYRIVPGPRRPPTPMRLRFDQTLEPFEGMLVSFEATAVAQRRVPVGTTLTLADRDSLLYVLAFGDAGPRLFGHVHSGERVRVTGVLGQHDTAAPYLQGYQLYPASREDIRVVGRGVAFYRLVALVVAGLLVLALGLIAFLQARSRRRLARQLQSEHRYRLLFEHTDDAVFLHQIVGEGVKGLRRIACNPAAEQLFGVTQAEWIKRGADVRLVDPEAAHAMAEKVRREGRVKTR